jgi:hypothetical protein
MEPGLGVSVVVVMAVGVVVVAVVIVVELAASGRRFSSRGDFCVVLLAAVLVSLGRVVSGCGIDASGGVIRDGIGNLVDVDWLELLESLEMRRTVNSVTAFDALGFAAWLL